MENLIKIKLLVHYWKENIVTLFNPLTKDKNPITLNGTINNYVNSIAFEGKVFIMGNNLFTMEKHQIDIKLKTLLQKANMMMEKRYHSLYLLNWRKNDKTKSEC